MKVKIGNTASKIWKYIKENGKIEMEDLKKATINENEVGANVRFFSALGWLLKEGKIEMQEKDEGIYISPK